ncbi:hypothetical protein [Paenibacillus sp. Y412MC10]|nr:hypothetical protein [Paenibacillus sp. Y412MC10]
MNGSEMMRGGRMRMMGRRRVLMVMMEWMGFVRIKKVGMIVRKNGV